MFDESEGLTRVGRFEVSPLHQKALLVMLCWFHLGGCWVDVAVFLGKGSIAEQPFPIDFDFLDPFALIIADLFLNEIIN